MVLSKSSIKPRTFLDNMILTCIPSLCHYSLTFHSFYFFFKCWPYEDAHSGYEWAMYLTLRNLHFKSPSPCSKTMFSSSLTSRDSRYYSEMTSPTPVLYSPLSEHQQIHPESGRFVSQEFERWILWEEN